MATEVDAAHLFESRHLDISTPAANIISGTGLVIYAPLHVCVCVYLWGLRGVLHHGGAAGGYCA